MIRMASNLFINLGRIDIFKYVESSDPQTQFLSSFI